MRKEKGLTSHNKVADHTEYMVLICINLSTIIDFTLA